MSIKRILGLDTGTNSLGWAVVDYNTISNKYSLIKRGDLIFQEGVKVEKGIEKSRAAERTQHKSTRIHYFRRRLRKIETLKVLIRHDMCPFISEEELKLWHAKKIYPKNELFLQWQRSTSSLNPYYYRYLCLTEKLDLSLQENRYALGRAIYHLSQRRGFLSNRLDSTPIDEEGKVKQGISDLSEEIKKSGCEFLGEYFFKVYSQYGNTVRIRSRYTDRKEHYLKEFEAICQRQSLEDSLIKEFKNALYFQRPLKSQKQSIGHCPFEKKKTRCSISHPDFEEFRMFAFINNIKIKTPKDDRMRPLLTEEVESILHLFYRKTKINFDFEDIAKTIAGKNNYAYFKDQSNKPYLFNYRMSQNVSGCPTITALRNIFGNNWRESIAESYLLNSTTKGIKGVNDMVNDVWNVLSFFDSKEHLKQFGIEKLQLDDDFADKFSNIRLQQGYASLSLNAIHKILPFLKRGYIYSHAVLFANLRNVLPKEYRNDNQELELLYNEVDKFIVNCKSEEKGMFQTLEFCIKDFVANRYNLTSCVTDKLYHPSMIETYPDAQKTSTGIYQLGSPQTNAIRNPMAMRSLHQLRKVINQLLRDGIIDNRTEIHIEYARELNNANRRKAISNYNKYQEDERKKVYDNIVSLYKEETGHKIIPSEKDILKYQLWQEQNGICIYTGKQIGITDFIGANPLYDIEHTIPRSVGGDTTKMNLTLCYNQYNRDIKRNFIPSQLGEHDVILQRIEHWKKKYEKLTHDIDKISTYPSMGKELKDRLIQHRHRLSLERDYWKGKYQRFIMTEVPEGFSRRQGAGIGIISKYAGLYLKSLFHDPNDRNVSNVYVVKGVTTAEFRRMWGLQDIYESKSRNNHVHHCIDAITIACIGKYQYQLMAQYYHEEEAFEFGIGQKPHFTKPWPTFTEDVLALEKELLVRHSTPDNLGKQAKHRLKGKRYGQISRGDSVRCSLHNDSYYGAIEHNGEVKYVIRRYVDSLKKSDIQNIVDDEVRRIISETFQKEGGLSEPIYMNKDKNIVIRKVRCYNNIKPLHIRKQRDLSEKRYKQNYHVCNDGNYIMGIYEGEVKGKIKRDYELINNLEAAGFYKKSAVHLDAMTPLPSKSCHNYPLKYSIRIGTMVLLWDESPEEIWHLNVKELCKRLYKVTGLSIKPTSGKTYGFITLRYHQEARQSKELKAINGPYKEKENYRPVITILHTQFKALVEGVDFKLDILGNLIRLK